MSATNYIQEQFHWPKELHICYYHAGCPDGICAAWAILQTQKEEPNTKFHAIKGHAEFKTIGIPAGCKEFNMNDYLGKSIIFVDVCPDEKSLTTMLDCAESIHILDHHTTNEALITKYKAHPKLRLSTIFDMERSGCQIAWDFVTGWNINLSLCKDPMSNSRDDQSRPWFINYVADRDLYKHELKIGRAHV